jgi:hypothetical protein
VRLAPFAFVSIKGERHTKRFKGNEADLKLVSSWLELQQTKPKKK